MLLFRGEKSNEDSNYHLEINLNVFSTWCEEKVFPAICNMGRKSFIVLDRATYNSAQDKEDKKLFNHRTNQQLPSLVKGGVDYHQIGLKIGEEEK